MELILIILVIILIRPNSSIKIWDIILYSVLLFNNIVYLRPPSILILIKKVLNNFIQVIILFRSNIFLKGKIWFLVVNWVG